MALKWCPGYTGTGDSADPADHGYSQARHPLEDDSAKGAANRNFGPKKSQCRTCYGVYARDWRARRNVGGAPAARRASVPRSRSAGPRPLIVLPDFRATALEAEAAERAASGDEEFVTDEDLAESRSHAYYPQPDLVETWAAVTNAAKNGSQPFNLMFLGPKGCGKTEGAQYLAGLVGLPFTKVDAASMTEPEAWFGTREVVADPESGASITTYRPSTFVLAVEQPGVLLIDEINRSRDADRNVLIPLMDNTHQVTNPLTGDVVVKHPRCFIIMSGNRGLNFTGTYSIDPALMSRALVVEFDYAPAEVEVQIAIESSGCLEATADMFVRFAADSRAKALLNPDFDPISTREVISACKLVKHGLTEDVAARMVVLNGASPEGGAASVRTALEIVWTGIRNGSGRTAPLVCGVEMVLPTGISVFCVVEVTPEKRALHELSGAHQHPDNPQHRSSPSEVDATGQPYTWWS